MTAFFRDVKGQDSIKRRMLGMVRSGRMPHALLICGPKDCGKLPMSLALARLLCCSRPGEDDSCGQCRSCKMMNKLAHPDVNFAFPIVKLKTGKETVCDDYIKEWRQTLIATDGYIDLPLWLDCIGADNKQAQIFTKETDEIQRKLAFKPMVSDRKVMLIWLPEKMNVEASNKLLKLLEEPPEGTVFLLVSEDTGTILPTILSRTQCVTMPPLSYGQLNHGDDDDTFFDLFKNLMRYAYGRQLRQIKEWTETVAALGREKQKGLLGYLQRMVRESFARNFNNPLLNAMNIEEQQFTEKFSPFVNTGNVEDIMVELELAQTHIEQNVNAKMVFFDLALQMILLLRRKC